MKKPMIPVLFGVCYGIFFGVLDNVLMNTAIGVLAGQDAGMGALIFSPFVSFTFFLLKLVLLFILLRNFFKTRQSIVAGFVAFFVVSVGFFVYHILGTFQQMNTSLDALREESSRTK